MQDARSLLRLFTVVLPVTLALAFVPASSASTPAVVPVPQATPTASLFFTSTNPAPVFGTSITLMATLTVAGTTSTSGTYSIYDGASALVEGALPNTPTGYAYVTSTLSVGKHALTAKYVGATNGLTATSAGIVVEVFPPQHLTVTTAALPAATVGSGYSTTLLAKDGAAPYQWSLVAPSTAPAGLSLSISGVLSGTPTKASGASPATFNVLVKDASGNLNGTATVSIQINPAPLKITSILLSPAGVVGTPYSQTLNAGGATNPVTWALSGNSALVAGLKLSGTGSISGTPTASTNGLGVFTVTATDSSISAKTATATISYTINPLPPTITSLSPSSAAPGDISTLIVNGTNFVTGATINWGGLPLPTTFKSTTQLTAIVPASRIPPAPGPVSVTVTTSGGTSAAATFMATAPKPAITSLNPATTVAGGPSLLLTINGANFVSGSTAKWGATTLATTFVSSTQLTATIQPTMIAAPGTGSVTVTGSTGTSSAVIFTVIPKKPAITSLSASSTAAGGPAFTLTVNGTNFVSGATAMWGTIPLVTSFVNAIQLTATVPADRIAAMGTANITVTTTGGTSNGLTFTMTQPKPAIASLSPTSVIVGGAGFTLTINGTNFTSGATAKWGITTLTTTYVSATQLHAAIPASLITAAGTASITVTTTGGTSAAATVTIKPPVPTIASLSPASGTAGGAAFTLTISGDNFASGVSGTTANWNGIALATTWVSAKIVKAQVTAAMMATAGTAKVTVTTAGGTSASATFTINPPPPTITSLSPTSAQMGGAGFVLTINGTNFQPNTPGTTAKWNSTPLNVTWYSTSKITTSITAAMIASAGTASITVTTAYGTSAPLSFNVNPPPPTITSLSPNSATAGGAAFTLTINGTNFTSTSTSKWGATPLVTTYSSATRLTAAVPASLITTPGKASITVTNAGGTSSGATLTIAQPKPTITSLSPASVIAGGPDLKLSINGTYFTPTATISMGSRPLAATYVSATLLTATVPSTWTSAAGTTSVTVSSTGDTSAAATFTILAPVPALFSLSPSSAVAGGVGFTLTANGDNFSTGAKIMWGATALTTTMVSKNVVTALVTAAMISLPGTVNVTVTTAGGTSGAKTFAINSNVSLPPPNLLSLGSATVNQNYAGFVNATGGGPNYSWTVNTASVPIAGTHVPLTLGLYAFNTGGYTLSIGGTPTGAGTVTFTAVVKDTATGVTSSPMMYSIIVNGGALHIVNGGIHSLNCGQPLGGVTVSINTNPVKTTTSNSDGAFSLSDIPNGTYTVTPSITGPTSLFYPVNQTAVVNGNDPNVNFQAVLGYTVSGTVTYSGSKSGRIYVELVNNNCGVDANPGTSIPAAGAFTIRGVPPGSYTLNAYMDNLGYGAQNASNPAGTQQSVNVSNANLASVSVTLTDPPPVTLSSPPSIAGVSPFSQGVFIPYQSTTNNKGVETPASYTVQWSTSATNFNTPAGSASFPATGKGRVWVLSANNLRGLSVGSTYYFRVQGVAGSSTSSWTAAIGPVTIGASTAGNSVSGTATFTGAATGPLYIGFYDQSTNKMYGIQVGSKTTPPTSPAPYTVKVPSGSNYFLFGIIDQNNNGLIDPGDIQNTNGDGAGAVVISGNAAQNLTLPSANSTISLTTQHQRQPSQGGGTYDNYGLYFQVIEQNKLPVAVALASGPHVLVPLDIGICIDCGGGFSFWVNTSNNVPVATDTYGLQITYSNGTSETLTAKVSTVLNAFASNLSPNSSGASATPKFTWTDPVGVSGYRYSFSLWDSNGNTIWQVPGNNSKSNGFDTSVTSLNWGVDPTDSNNKPNLTSLTPGSYQWQIQARDSSYNQSSMQANFTVAGGNTGLSLPSKPSSLPSAAIVGHSYSGTIDATGGPGGRGYNWAVNGIQIPTNNTPKLIANGLSANNSGGNTLTIAGTPTAAQTVTLNVSVADNMGDPSASATYTINVTNGSTLALPSSGTASALVGYPFSESVNVSGGVPPYTWMVNGHQMSFAGGTVTLTDNLTATSTGGDTLTISGTPSTTLSSYPISVSVADSASGSVGPVQYSVVVASVPIGMHNGYLSGRYTCLTEGFKDSNGGSRWASLGSLQVNGSGSFTGIFDVNGRAFTNGAVSGTITGTYTIGADNNGLVTMTSTPPGNTTKWALALTNTAQPAQQFCMVEVDDVGTSSSGQHGTANCYLATTSAFAASTLSGSSFAMGMNGENNNGNTRAVVGRFSASSGNITSGNIDLAKGGNSAVETDSFTGTYGTPDATTGRVSVASNSGGNALSMVIYIIDANRSFILDTLANDGLLAGNVRKQQQASYSGANISGPFVLYMQGVEYNNGNGGSPSASYSELMRGTGDGAGHMTINASYMDNSGQYSVGSANGTPGALVFSSTHPGRVTIPAGNNSTVYLYLFNTNNAFEMSVNGAGSVDSGWVEPQTATTYTNAAVAGTYLMGNMPALFAGTSSNVGELKLDGSGNITGGVTNAGDGDFSFDQPFSANYNWDPLNQFAFLVGNGQASCILINPTKAVCTPRTDSTPSIMILQQ